MSDGLLSILGPGLGVGFMIIGLVIPTIVLLIGINSLRSGPPNPQSRSSTGKANSYPILWP